MSLQIESLSPEEVDMLRDAFIYMDRDNDGHVSKSELLDMVMRCVGEERYGPLASYLIPLFEVADKDQDGKLSLCEFIMSFVDGPGVIPAEVVNSCVSSIRVRLTDEEIVTLQESFRRIDTNADGYIDKEELVAALKENLKDRFPDLQESNFHDIVAVIMASADVDNDGRLCLSEFIRSFQEDQGVLPAVFVDARSRCLVQHLSPEEVDVLREAFATLDRDHDGYIGFADIYETLWDAASSENCDKNQIYELCDLIMVTTDRNKSGVITLEDFVRGFIRNATLVQLPVAAAQQRMLWSCERIKEMLESGELEQLSGLSENGFNSSRCVNPGDLVCTLSGIFREVFPLLDEEVLSSMIGALVAASENDVDRKFGLDEFISCFTGGPWAVTDDGGGAEDEAKISDSDVQTVSRLLKDLEKDAGEEGKVQEPDVLGALRHTFRSDPEKADRVAQYVQRNMTRPGSMSSFTGRLTSSHAVPVDNSPRGEVERLVKCSDAAVQYEQSLECAKDTVKGNEAWGGNDVSTQQQQQQQQEAAAPPEKSESVAKRTPNKLRDLIRGKNGGVVPTRSIGGGASEGAHSNARLSGVGGHQHAHSCLFAPDIDENQRGMEVKLLREFEKLSEGRDYIDRGRFVKLYLSMEHYGLVPSETEVNNLVSRYCKGDKLGFNEFCIIMLRRVGM